MSSQFPELHVTAELTERKKKALGISRDIEGGFYVSKEDFVKVRLLNSHI